ncbi:UDP-N-acetylmuramoyl-L-alanyl-D-glutamate--2,6-diaminopimelate ligase [Colwellia sp. E2M01]|uniref:UDP-N-acetylmuramoyl-L-alanyl-D-glutamate--2, 6-diaminopimelate ligase n=1 Tax=Colwellia sp. E2M01 TaxID=2841561 RepID=UPI001C0841EB|nr:UDP-N-acetylmuramoyl-L-alanyl-D-glutamate--2,6-diaminopimelate ligase [Colwellia sp. E2M01]MBU2870224.1 UDP-N-acetylmuramoyl-L-alanyl-D-glutamate--2,6-diaminopimelate ligase [Colwellia sp. E2M01]
MLKPATQQIINSLKAFDINLTVTGIKPQLNFTGLHGDLHNDSRRIQSNDIFCAIIGHEQDGRQYIEKAIKKGAKLVIAECENSVEHGEVSLINTVAVVNFYQLNQHLFSLAKAYYQAPQDNMTIVGITGTNGKTTTSQLLAQMLNAYAKPCAVIGTNGAGGLNNLQTIENTTPGACELHQLLYRFDAKSAATTAQSNQEHFSYVAMEVSSHALSQKRVQADLFDIALFTNLSRDHLDYHGSMANYGEAKKQIFSVATKQVAVINCDDAQGKKWLENRAEQSAVNNQNQQATWVYSRLEKIENLQSYQYFVSAKDILHHSHGVAFTLATHLGNVQITSPLLGDFNIDNLLAAISVLLIQGIVLDDIPNLVTKVTAISGRMEATSAEGFATAVVDYAHTPDALEKALQACRQHCHGELYVVFGCGGDRDKGKRPLMAKAAEQYADVIVVTNDNPRSENARLIADDIVAGFNTPEDKKITITLDREQAVLNTLKVAKAGDIVLLAGKGHEDYVVVAKHNAAGDVVGTEKIDYNERLVVSRFYQQQASVTSKAQASATEAKV